MTAPPASLQRLQATRQALGLAGGLALLFWPSASVEVFIRGASALLLLDGLLAGLAASRSGPRIEGRLLRLESAWSLVMALAIWSQPIFSILTLSFVLELQIILWLAGFGMLQLARWAGGMPRAWLPGLIASGAALALHLSPGAGAVDRRLALGLVLLALALSSGSRHPGRRAEETGA